MIDKLTALSDGLDTVSGTLSGQYSALMERVQDLEDRMLNPTAEASSPSRRKDVKKPYKRRSKAHIELSVRPSGSHSLRKAVLTLILVYRQKSEGTSTLCSMPMKIHLSMKIRQKNSNRRAKRPQRLVVVVPITSKSMSSEDHIALGMSQRRWSSPNTTSSPTSFLTPTLRQSRKLSSPG